MRTLCFSLCLLLTACAALVTGCSGGNAASETAAANLTRPCDLFSSSTPCVAAFSTVRSLVGSYAGPLYQVTRQSDGTTLNIGLLSDGYANATSQDTFCNNTTCTITEIFDQTSNHNDLTIAPPGGAARGTGTNGYDEPSIANALPITAGGHHVYGLSILPGMGYRNDTAHSTATNGQAEGVYMTGSTLPLNGRCCFDFGNAETSNTDNGAGHMDAISMRCAFGSPCTYQAGLDMENGIYGKLDIAASAKFVTAMGANDGQQNFTIWQGDAQAGGLTSTGPAALPAKYAPMQQEGAIILGIGGDNSNGAAGYFFEGVMTLGAPSDATMQSVQANIAAAGYSGL